MTPEDITIIIAGPLHACGIEAIPYYLSKSLKVVYSTWTPKSVNDEAIFSRVKQLLQDENIVISEPFAVSPSINHQNVYYQAYTWNQATKVCKTSHCIKIRSSCKYEYIDPLIEAIIDNPDKVITISALFRPCWRYVYSPSDFVIGMRTSVAVGTTEHLLAALMTEDPPRLHYPAETKVCLSTLEYRGTISKFNPTPSQSTLISDQSACKKEYLTYPIPPLDESQQELLDTARENMRNTYVIVDVNKLKPTLFWGNGDPQIYIKHDSGHTANIDDV